MFPSNSTQYEHFHRQKTVVFVHLNGNTVEFAIPNERGIGYTLIIIKGDWLDKILIEEYVIHFRVI